MKTYKLSDLYEMSSGISSKKEQAGHGSPFASFSTVFNNTFLPDVLPDLMDTSEKEKETYSIKVGDIFLTRTSETLDELGMSSVAVKDYPNASYSGFLKRLRPTQKNITYAKFMAFYLRSYLFRKTMNNNATMTLRASLNEQIFSYLDIVLPEYNEQVKIGDLFYKISQKIEINNKINQELEAMAKTLYDYWFVQFDFPAHLSGTLSGVEGYKSSGGKMVFNEELKREIPFGWESGTLGQLCTRIGDGLHGTPKYVDNSDYSFINGNNLKNGFITTDNDTKKVSAEEYEKHFIELNDNSILLSINGTLGNLAIYNDEKVMLGKSSAYINCKEDYKTYCYEYLNQNHMPKVFWNIATGSTIKNLGLSSIKNLKILKPEIDIILAFSKITNPIVEKRKNIFKQNQKLSELRDWLLPMLMNGQVTVGGAEKVVSSLRGEPVSSEVKIKKPYNENANNSLDLVAEESEIYKTKKKK